MTMRGAIFDIDGTLLDSMHIWDSIGEIYLRWKNIVPRATLREELRAKSLLQAAMYFRASYGIADTLEKIMRDINSLIEDFYFNEAMPKPGAEELLKRLRDAGIKMYAATATDRYLMETALARCSLIGYFDGMITCTEAGAGKDRPDIYFKAMEALGTEMSDTYVFEDAFFAVRTAKKAGFTVIAVADKTTEAYSDRIKALADQYIESYDEFVF